MDDRFEAPKSNDVARRKCESDEFNLNDARSEWSTSSQLLNPQIRCLQ
jgi:hypothetical protein